MLTRETKELAEKAAKRYEMEMRQRGQRPAAQTPRKIITISRMVGSKGKGVAELLGAELGCQVWDREILDAIAQQSYGPQHKRMLDALDENTQGQIGAMLSSISGQVGASSYLYQLPKVVFLIGQNDAVIVGRGANLILPDSFRVLIKASRATRVRWQAESAGLSQAEAEIQIATLERQRTDFLLQLARSLGHKGLDGDDGLAHDLEINLDRISPEDAADLILHTARRRWQATQGE